MEAKQIFRKASVKNIERGRNPLVSSGFVCYVKKAKNERAPFTLRNFCISKMYSDDIILVLSLEYGV